MTKGKSPNPPREIGSAIGHVNQLGTATEHLFTRLYKSLRRRSKMQEREQRRAELNKQIEQARKIHQVNRHLKNNLQRQEEELERLHGILAVIEEGIIVQDNEGRIVFVNKAAREFLGSQKNFWSSELGSMFDDFRSLAIVSSEIEPLGDPTTVQINGRVLGAQIAALANDLGDRLGSMIVLRDVTREALADRLKDQFVTAISHELKTPMTVIKGMSEVLLGSPAEAPPNRRLLETLSRNVDILDRMVVELLDVSEMGAGTFSVREDRIELEPLINSVIKGAVPDLKKGKLEIFVMFRDNDRLVVRGDVQHLRWAFGHLIRNAIGYNLPGGKIYVTVHMDNILPFVNIVIRDTGVGISSRDLPHIFERFYRGDPRDKDGRLVDPRGLGQGLFIARTIAEAHRGSLHVRSETNKGSMFTLMLPPITS
jgi:signal transduction histidine kinase